jgi:putative hydrolase
MFKNWTKYSGYLLSGEWHIHTSWTDGDNSVFEYCEKAVKEGIPLLAFTEHVRRTLDYDFGQFLSEIEQVRARYNLIVLSGCEAKVLPGGKLDVEECVLKEVDYPIFAFHSFPSDIDQYLESLKVVLSNRYINAWAHPGYFLSRQGLELPDKDLIEIFDRSSRHNILLEVNRKYNLPPPRWFDLAKSLGIRLVRGSDIHNVNKMNRNYMV